jgi:low affinity Fe/Cu permease
VPSVPSRHKISFKLWRASPLVAWLTIGALALIGFFSVWWVYRPGFMSVDSVAQLGEARSGAFTDFHPPILALIWRYLDEIWPGPIGMLILLDGLFWLGLAIFFRLLRWPLWARASSLIVAGFQPAVFMLLGTIWKDTLMQACLIAGASAILLAAYSGRRLWWLVALPLMFVAIAARHNGIGAAWPLLAIPIFGVGRIARFRRFWQLALSLAVALVIALTLRQGSSLLSRKIAAPSEYWQMTPIFDLAGMSLQVDELLMKPEDGILSPGVTLARVRQVYSPRDHLRLYKCSSKNCTPAFVRTRDAEKLRTLSASWQRAIWAHPGAYLAHRWLVFRELLRLDPRKVEISTGISRNRLGVPVTRSEAAVTVVKLLGGLPNVPFYATWIYVLLECALLLIGAFDFFKRGRPHCLCWSMSGLIYLATFFFATGAPDFRYSTWTILTTLLAACSLAGFARRPARSV